MQLLIGTYTNGPADGIYRTEFDPRRGTFAAAELLARTENPSWLLHDPARGRVFAVNERSGRGEVVWFDLVGDRLCERQRVDSMGGLPCHLGLHQDELAVANYEDGVVARWDVAGEGFVLRAVRRHSGASVHPRQRGPHAHGVLARFGGWLVTDLGADRIFLHDDEGFRPWLELPPGTGPRMLAPSGNRLFVVGELDNHLYVVSDRGEIEARVRALPPGQTRGQAAHVAVRPDGWVVVSNRGPDSLALIDPAGVEPRVVDWWSSGGAHPRHFLVGRETGQLVVANRDSGDVVALGPTGEVRGRVAVPAPACIVEVA